MYVRSTVQKLITIIFLISVYGSASAGENNIICSSKNSNIELFTNKKLKQVDEERLNFIKDELKQIALEKSNNITKCKLKIFINLSNTFQNKGENISFYKKEQELESFRIIHERSNSEFNKVEIYSNSSLGALYGVYEILDALGVRYYSTSVTLIPDKFDWMLIPNEKTVSPVMPLRGTWTFGKNLDSKFLLWAGRNRLNLVGGDFAQGDRYRRIFGIFNWTGGHNVISYLTPTDRLVKGKLLAEEHPEWFGGRADHEHIPYGSDDYLNPCFGDSGYIKYFTDALIEQILTGMYKNSDFINIWPSDQINVTVPQGCRHTQGSVSGLDDFTFFINNVSKAIATDFRLQSLGQRPMILGISYQGDYDQSHNNLLLNSPDTPNYLHIFYQDLRSHSARFFDASSQVNSQMANALVGTVKHHQLKEFGIVEYHGFSVYRGMFIGDPNQYSDDIRTYAEKGSVLYAYMHPSLDATVPEMLLNRTISRTLFGGDSPSSILRDFQKNILGGDPAAIRAYELYEKALHNKSEFFGSNLSLYSVLWYDIFWDPPLLSTAQAEQIMNIYLDGGITSLPPIRIRWPNYDNVALPSLRTAINDLDSSEKNFNVVVQSKNSRNIKRLSLEVQRANLIHKIFMQLYDIRQIESEGKSCTDALDKLNASINKVLSYEWPEYVSEFEIKNSYSGSLKVMLDKLSNAQCAN